MNDTHAKPSAARSPHWPAVRAAHLEIEPECQACGGIDALEVHHVRPHHVHPELELEQDNLVTLCEHPGRNCHFVFGHAHHWHGWNDHVRRDVAVFREREKASEQHAKQGV